MNLLISYNLMYHNWYVGEFYKFFHDNLKQIHGINVEYRSLDDLSSFYKIPMDYHNGLPSIFSPYNLIITNKDTKKTFIHSWHDYAPAMLNPNSGISNLDVTKFSCVSRLTQSLIDNYDGDIVIQPSVYLLENWDDHHLIEKNRKNLKDRERLYFNGLCYGIRNTYRNILNKSEYFEFKKKDGPDYLYKPNYYEELSKYKYGINLDGAAQICYRDLEYFGMGVVLFRENLDVLTYNPILKDEHYIELFDKEIKGLINNIDNEKIILSKLESKLDEILSQKDKLSHIVNNSYNWYLENCLPENQYKIIFSFLKDFSIFE